MMIEPQSTGERMFHEIATEEQSRAYLDELVTQLETVRLETDKATIVELKQAKYRETLIRYGRALGALITLMHCRKISDEAYNRYHGLIQRALLPSVTSIIQD